MVWQDIVISAANLVFTYSIAHQVYYGFKKKKGLVTSMASGLTSIGLCAMVISFFTLSLYFSAFVAAINAGLWFVLFIQRRIYEKA